MLKQNEEVIPLASLLRTRDVLPNGIIRASWTLYQPHALVWNHAFWNSKANFAKRNGCRNQEYSTMSMGSHHPLFFLEQWQAFLKLLCSHNFQGSDVDSAVLPLVPMFHTETYNKPGQSDLGLHQRSFSHRTVSEKKALTQISQMYPSKVLLPKKVNVTKQTRFAQHCVAAASQLLTPQQTGALKNAGMQRSCVLLCT